MDTLNIAFKTRIGGQNHKDEESFLCGDNLFIVVEGMGGEYLSDIAKERACQTIYNSFFKHLSEKHSPSDALYSALRAANDEILMERKKLGEKMAASLSRTKSCTSAISAIRGYIVFKEGN